jgi:hypothetical protein
MEQEQQMGMAANEGILPAVSAFLNREHGLFIEGKWQSATSGQVFSVQKFCDGMRDLADRHGQCRGRATRRRVRAPRIPGRALERPDASYARAHPFAVR